MVSRPMVNEERGARAGSSPHSRHTGWLRRLPTRSCSAADRDARAAPFFGISWANLASAASRSKGFLGRWGSSFSSAARTVSAVSPSLHSIPIGEADPHHPRVVIAAPGDDEWMLGLQGENVGGELQSHLRRFNHHTITSETMTILATATQKPSGSWTSGMRLKFIP